LITNSFVALFLERVIELRAQLVNLTEELFKLERWDATISNSNALSVIESFPDYYTPRYQKAIKEKYFELHGFIKGLLDRLKIEVQKN